MHGYAKLSKNYELAYIIRVISRYYDLLRLLWVLGVLVELGNEFKK